VSFHALGRRGVGGVGNQAGARTGPDVKKKATIPDTLNTSASGSTERTRVPVVLQ